MEGTICQVGKKIEVAGGTAANVPPLPAYSVIRSPTLSHTQAHTMAHEDEFSYSYISTLWLGLDNGTLRLYSGPQDDAEISAYGGKTLTVAGCFFADKTHVIIEEVYSDCYYANGHRLVLCSSPFIINAKTRKVVSVETMKKLGMGAEPARRPGSRKTPPNWEVLRKLDRSSEIAAIVARGGIARYIEWLFSQQAHIRSCVDAKKAAMVPNKERIVWTAEMGDAWLASCVAARAEADRICSTPIKAH